MNLLTPLLLSCLSSVQPVDQAEEHTLLPVSLLPVPLPYDQQASLPPQPPDRLDTLVAIKQMAQFSMEDELLEAKQKSIV